jgi:hypothetical protein
VTLSSGGAAGTAAAGGYNIVPTNAVGSGLGNYTINYANGTLTVSPAALSITASNSSKTYGQTVTFAGTEFGSSGLVNGDSVTSVTLSSGGTAGTAAVGGYNIVPTNAVGSGLTNYTIGYANGTLTVNPAALTVNANAKNKTYGDADPSLTYQITSGSLVNGDSLTGALSRVAGENVGSYPIQQGTVSAGSNYTLSYVGANFRILRRTLAVRADNNSRVYGQINPIFTATYITFVNGDGPGSLGGTLLFNTAANPTSRVGSYSVTPSGLISSNYTINFAVGTLTVNPAALMVTANNANKTYGQTLTFAGTELGTTGLVNGDSVTSVTLSSGGAVATAGVGSYTIVPSNAAGSGLANYTISYANGTLTVNTAVLTAKADDKSRSFGSTNPVFTISYSGFANGDNTNVLTSLPTAETTATTASTAGTYPISLTGGTAANYSFNLVGGNLTITPPANVILTSIVRVPVNNVQITGTGDTNVVYTIQASSDLVNWQNIGTAATGGSGVFQFGDTNAANFTTRFYRASLP